MKRYFIVSIRLVLSIVLILSFLTRFAHSYSLTQFIDTTKIKVFILAGQSNAVGYNDFKEYAGDSNALLQHIAALRHVRFWPGSNSRKELQNKWNALHIGASDISSDDPFKQSFGPEIGMAMTLANALPDEKIAIIKFAAGGTGIARSEDYSDYIPALNGFDDKGVNWHPASDNKQSGSLYLALIDNIKKALASLENANQQYEICGFLWMQGEHEAGISKKMAEDYGSLLSTFRMAVRKDLNLKKLPFVVGEINSHTWAFADIARNKQKKSCLRDRLSVLINTTDLPRGGRGGDAHFTSDAMLELGERFAHGALQFMSK